MKIFIYLNRSLVSVTGYEMNQSLELPLSNKDTLILVGSLDNEERNGSGSLNVTLRRVLHSNTYLDVLLIQI